MTALLLAVLLASPSDSIPAIPRDSSAPVVSAPSTTDSAKPSAAAIQPTPGAEVPMVPVVAVPVPPAPVSAPGPVPGPVAAPGPTTAPGPVPAPGPAPARGPIVVPSTSIAFGPTGAIITVDTTSSSKGPSTLSAVGLSLILPGAGHTWAGYGGRAPAYHALDLLGWAALFISWQYGNGALASAAEIADRYAGASLGSSPDPALLSLMRSYRSRRPVGGRQDSYDQAQILSGLSTTAQFPDDAAHGWDWGSPENPANNLHLQEFENQYRRWRASQVALYSAAGTLVVLRLVAALDVLRLEKSSAAKAGVAMEIGPTADGVDARVSWKF